MPSLLRAQLSSTLGLPALAALSLALGAASLDAQSLTSTRLLSGLSRPVYVTAPRGDLHRIFILEQWTARIRIYRDGVLLPTAFLDIGPLVMDNSGEMGLLGMAFHPQYATNGYFFVHYNDNSGSTVIARYRISPNRDVADPTSALIVYTASQPYFNHKGGMIDFGRDGYLYFGLGDGGGSNDPGNRAQSLTEPLGKILRIDVDHPSGGRQYGIPPTNPFAGSTTALPEIWAFGLRNPWRWSFDRATGDMYIGDVGQSTREEISFHAAASHGGSNYGWRCMEGTVCTGQSGCTCNAPNLVLPIHDYDRSAGWCVIGGFVYRGCGIPGLQGAYFFADCATSTIWSFRYANGSLTEHTDRTMQLRPPGNGGTIISISSFGEDGLGELYVCDLREGEVFKIVPASLSDCNSNGRADRCDLAHGLSFDLDGNGQPDECQSFYADRATLSVSTGGAQSLHLRGTPAQGGSTYLVAGSVSGTSPGLALGGGLVLPLNPDSYFLLTLLTPNTAVLTNALGTLDASGRATATFHLPRGVPQLLGLTAYHSWVRLLPALDFASNFVKVDLVL